MKRNQPRRIRRRNWTPLPDYEKFAIDTDFDFIRLRVKTAVAARLSEIGNCDACGENGICRRASYGSPDKLPLPKNSISDELRNLYLAFAVKL